MSDALEDFLALVDLGDLLVQELVSALAKLNDAGVGSDPSCATSVSSLASVLIHRAREGDGAPETSLRTFWEISAATLYLVMVSGFASE